VRPFGVAVFLSLIMTTAAIADADVAGTWRTRLGHGVTIDMKVTPNGKWTSQTSQSGKVLRHIKGTYTQQPSNNTSGSIVFTPTQSSAPSGSVDVETDQYEIADNGKKLKLTTEGDTMVFEKRDRH
jgi:hypothetical protein